MVYKIIMTLKLFQWKVNVYITEATSVLLNTTYSVNQIYIEFPSTEEFYKETNLDQMNEMISDWVTITYIRIYNLYNYNYKHTNVWTTEYKTCNSQTLAIFRSLFTIYIRVFDKF